MDPDPEASHSEDALSIAEVPDICSIEEYNDIEWLCGMGFVEESSREVGERGREVGSPLPSGCSLSQNWGGTELNRTVTCMMLKATANDRRTSSPLP
ncbi:hypothetical protein TNCV_877331 [Trichonephila clavipes]|nr:hypothetical protein TNCV_877331 [Trichonephila clavipes]